MNYENFKEYVHKIVLYQSNNKKFKHFSIKRKTTLNLTIRQLAKLTETSKSTVHRWLKKMEEEGLLILAEETRAKRDKTNRLFKAMKFYQVISVLNIIKAKAKKRAYSYIRKSVAISKDPSGTLKKLIQSINYKYTRNKRVKVRSFKIKIVKTDSSPYFMLQAKGEQIEIGERIDLRRKDLKSINKLTSSEIAKRISSFGEMLI